MATDRKLHDFPRPTVAVDIAVLTINDERLAVLEMARDDGAWALPGAFVRERETLAQAVERCLWQKVGITGVRPRQLGVFDDPDRDERDWVISVAHVVVVRPEAVPAPGSGSARDIRLMPADRPGKLVWDHPKMIRLARDDVRTRYAERPDPERLLGEEFTLPELQALHQAVAGHELARDSFRRLMEPQLSDTGMVEVTGGRGRPAALYKRRR